MGSLKLKKQKHRSVSWNINRNSLILLRDNGSESSIIFIIFWDFDVLPNFSFTTSEKMRHYYLWTLYIWVASKVAERLKKLELRKLRNIMNINECFFHIFVLTSFMRRFHERFSLIRIPRSLVTFSLSVAILSISKNGSGSLKNLFSFQG